MTTPVPLTSTPVGLLALDKPEGITSHGCVAAARRAMGTRKVGHAGTLDPMATGVLLLGVGRGTRLLGHLALHDKDYTATIRLGSSTITDDREGDVVSVADAAAVAAISEDAIRAGIIPLTGEIEQVPTAVSAIKVDGKRAHARVRAGEEVDLKARRVTVERFEIVDIRRGDGCIDLDVEVTCSTGTYVRALARDLGASLGVGGHLTSLRRTRVGAWTISACASWADLTESDDPRGLLIPLADVARRSFPVVEVDDAGALWVRNGRPVRELLDSSPEDVTAILGPGGVLLALVGPSERGGTYLAVFVP